MTMLESSDVDSMLNHGTGYTRGLAAMHLGRIDDGNPKVLVPALVPHLKDKDVYVREMAALSLGHIHQDPEQVANEPSTNQSH